MSSTTNVSSLFQSAVQQGSLSQASAQMLTLPHVGAQIQQAMGVPAGNIQASEVCLITDMLDDSGSIRMGSNSQAVRDGHNGVIDALMGSKQKDSVLMHSRYLNGYVLYPYGPLDQAVKMDKHNYNPTGGTPLYDMTIVLLGTVKAKTQEFNDNGIPVRTATLIVTDGMDEGSMNFTEADCNRLISDMLMTEQHIIAAMGVQNPYTDFWDVFTGWSAVEIEAERRNRLGSVPAGRELEGLAPKGGMGILPSWVLTPQSSAHEIRQAFAVFSQSAVRTSQSAASFSQLGGFASP